MKTLRLTTILCLALTLGGLFAATTRAAAAERVRLHAFLITAANGSPGKSDPRLAAYEPTLKRLLRFDSFEYQGSDRGDIAAHESTTLMIGQGHELTLEAGDNPLQLKVRWSSEVGARTLINSGFTFRRAGNPVVLGGPPTGRSPGEVYAVFILAQ